MLEQSAADILNARLIRDMIFRRDAELESEPEPYQPEGKAESERKRPA